MRRWCEDRNFASQKFRLTPGTAIFQILKSDSCSDSACNHPSNRNLPMFLLKKWPQRLLQLPKMKNYSVSASGFSQIKKKKKTQYPAGADSGTPDPKPLVGTRGRHRSGLLVRGRDVRTVKFWYPDPVLIF